MKIAATGERTYRATSFPTGWTQITTLVKGAPFGDSSIFRHDGSWWLLTESNSERRSDTLRLFAADDLLGPWHEHPASPVVEGDARVARPAGRVVVSDGRIFRYAQDCHDRYGESVSAFEITLLTSSRYEERHVGRVLTPGGGSWNSGGMHHIDAHQLDDGRWLACVDGQ